MTRHVINPYNLSIEPGKRGHSPNENAVQRCQLAFCALFRFGTGNHRTDEAFEVVHSGKLNFGGVFSIYHDPRDEIVRRVKRLGLLRHFVH